jgi:hypothetical protein
LLEVLASMIGLASIIVKTLRLRSTA